MELQYSNVAGIFSEIKGSSESIGLTEESFERSKLIGFASDGTVEIRTVS